MSLLSYVQDSNVRQHHVAVQQLPEAPATAVVESESDSASSVSHNEPAPVRKIASRTDARAALLAMIHQHVVAGLDSEQLSEQGDPLTSEQLRREVERSAEAHLIEADPTMSRAERGRIVVEISDDVLGLGPLAPLLRDPTITEIVVNAFDQVFCERNGRLYPTECSFRDDEHVLQIVQRILWPLGRRLDLASPMVDARLPDGSRLNAIIPPLSVLGPAITIRKFSRYCLRAEDLVRYGTLTDPAVVFLAACVRARLNILVSGGTGSGKTTLLNVLSGFIPPHERIITIEDPAELQIQHSDRVSLETRPPNIDGKGRVEQRDLLKNALRMRPDRIIIGECRGPEAFDMLQAMNTGHDGSLTTLHANSARDALARIQNMVLMAVELPVQAIREQIASGINLVVHLARQQDGSRKITQISEILPLNEPVITMQDIFRLTREAPGADGPVPLVLKPTGMQPHFQDRLTFAGQGLPPGFLASDY